MSKILVIGDLIIDQYRMCRVDRLCPEAPVPVLIQTTPTFETRGGAGLVAAQLKELLSEDRVIELMGSVSRKERIFADGRLIARLDYDSISLYDQDSMIKVALEQMRDSVEFIVFSDYGKGGVSDKLIREVFAAQAGQRIFVDAKNRWERYRGADFFFPNKEEWLGLTSIRGQIIRKLGAEGCQINGETIYPVPKHEVKDVSGAGDIFLAGFVAAWYNGRDIVSAAQFANGLANRSVQYIGTHIVKKEEI